MVFSMNIGAGAILNSPPSFRNTFGTHSMHLNNHLQRGVSIHQEDSSTSGFSAKRFVESVLLIIILKVYGGCSSYDDKLEAGIRGWYERCP